MTEQPLTFVPSDSVLEENAAIFEAHARRIRERLPQVEVRQHGGSAAPGLVTAGDVDVHVRVDIESFTPARDALCELYEPTLREKWNEQVAYYIAPGARPPVEIVLTLIGSSDDLHHGAAWERILSDPALVERYNALKREHEGGRLDDLKSAKRAFFYEVVRGLRETD
jgi:GrpB-like predicted nucleotidyltransferase (UPF0157 family)